MVNEQKHKHIDIRRLDAAVRAEAESMILSNAFTFREIAERISEITGMNVTQISVCRYLRFLCDRE